MDNRVSILIPARKNSSRLPDKLLLSETGLPLIVHTCQRAAQAFGSDQVIVCADDDSIVEVVTAAGFTAQLTAPDHESGTDRIAEVAAQLSSDIIVNVQGDEPEIDPVHIRLVASLLNAHDWAGMATLATPGTVEDQTNPNAVKVVLGAGQRALSFTRAPSPWDRDAGRPAQNCYRHIGMYAYRKDILLNYHALPTSHLETCEKLEQLRALEAGIGMACATVDNAPAGIDVRADYDAFLQRHSDSL